MKKCASPLFQTWIVAVFGASFVCLLRLIDGNNITTDDHHMWLIPFFSGEHHTLNVTFSKAQTVAGLRIWNYNRSPEDSYRGVRHSAWVSQCIL